MESTLTKKRGKILRDTSMGPGLLMIDGKQHLFTLEGLWQSDQAPRINMSVEAAFDEHGALAALVPLPDSQLAREQADLALAAAKARGGEMASSMVARFGVRTLAALALLAVAWFFLNTLSVQVSGSFKIGLTFWKLLAVLNSPSGVMAGFSGGDGSAGVYGLFAVLALAAPLAPELWKDRRAHLGGLAPLLFMLFIAFMFYQGVSSGMSEAQSAMGKFSDPSMAKMMNEARSAMVSAALGAISIGAGAYLALAASLYFAWQGAIKFLARRA